MMSKEEVMTQIYSKESDDLYRTYMTKEEIEQRQKLSSAKKRKKRKT